MIDLETMSVLVVDDMKSMRLTIRKMLRNLNIGKMLRFAENGKAGLEVLATTPCDLAIIDWNMPVMNGSEMLNRLRQDKVLRDMPVIMVTAENERDIVSEVAEHEIDAYLLKPLTLAALDKKIKMVVHNANNPDQATVHILKARESEEAEDYEAAIEQIRLALRHKPSASRILRKLGLLHFKIGKTGIGEKCLQKAISVNRQDTISRDNLARLYVKRKEYKKAAKIYLEILSLSKRYFGTATRLGETMLVNGYKGEAIELFSRIIAKSKRNNALKDKIIDICQENHEVEFAASLMEQSLKENPSNYDLMYKLGMLSFDAGDYEKALSYFRTIDSHKKGHVDAKLQIARIYYINRRVLQADEYLRQVLRLDPGNKDALSLRQQF
ncbi:MAG: response regulator [Desulfobacterales bacterium]|nr:response regulator [Desulfobacterales bacterium]